MPIHVFPNLLTTGYKVTSPSDRRYNCIAWAAGDSLQWWWPILPYHWPDGVSREVTLDAFIQAYGTVGYLSCSDGSLEPGIEKVAIYAIGTDVKHAARQLPNGNWTSKLGKEVDIEHTLEGVAGSVYGTAVHFLQRSRTP